MLEKAQGQNCQATNFLKTFTSLPQTAHLGLVDEGSGQKALSFMIQATNRYLLDKIIVDFEQTAARDQGHAMQANLETRLTSHIRCEFCANETVKEIVTNVHDLVYPDHPPQRAHHVPTFSQVLKSSVERQEHTRAWCDRCKRYQQLSTSKTIRMIPPVLMIHAAMHNTVARQLWSRPGWLPREIGIIVQHGQFFCYEGKDLQAHLQRGKFAIEVYELVGVVADVQISEHQKSHLVSIINGELVPSRKYQY